MNELGRLIEDGAEDSFLRGVLESANDDVPDAARRALTLGKLAPDVAAAAASATNAHATPATSASSTGSGAALKWFVVVGLAAFAFAIVTFASGRADPVKGTPSRAIDPAPAVSTASPAPAAQPIDLAPAHVLGPSDIPSALSLPRAPAAPVTTAASGHALRVDSAPKASAAIKECAPLGLAEETAILDRARGAIARGEPRAALVELDGYDAARGPKILGQEATLVRIEALSAKGDTAAARALAQAFLAKNPGSTYDERVHTLLGEPKKP